jgi:hypothetical protein
MPFVCAVEAQLSDACNVGKPLLETLGVGDPVRLPDGLGFDASGTALDDRKTDSLFGPCETSTYVVFYNKTTSWFPPSWEGTLFGRR